MRRLLLISTILVAQFAILEAGLRIFGSGLEATRGFESLFMPDAQIGYRLRPGASARFTTREFSTVLTINPQGVRDAEPIGPKAPTERRVLILGDSFVFAVQVPLDETFVEQLEARLNAGDGAHLWRAINGGVQGYGPVEQWLFYEHVAKTFAPDIVLIVVSVGNDAIEAFDERAKFELGRVPDGTPVEQGRIRFRRVVRSSMVLQLVRLRAEQLRARAFSATPERPLAGYLDHPPGFVSDGLRIAARAFGRIAADARASGAKVGFVLMPARFQSNDEDYRRVSEVVARTGGTLVRQAASERFTAVLRPLGEPMLDLLPVLAAQDPDESFYFILNAHLSPRGHRVVADAILEFLRTNGLTAADGS